MKTWTVVVEIKTDDVRRNVENWMHDTLSEHIGSATFRIVETIEAPYGAQHKKGVWLVGPRSNQEKPWSLGEPTDHDIKREELGLGHEPLDIEDAT